MHLTVNPRTADILEGIEDLTSWDDEELLRGQRRNSKGIFCGRPPKVVPQEVHAERVRRTMSRAFNLLKESSYDAVKLLRNVVNDERAPVPYRIEAARLILDRVVPKSLNLAVTTEPKWLAAIRGGLELTPGHSDDDVIDVDGMDAEEAGLFSLPNGG
jgi:hypothetical protein